MRYHSVQLGLIAISALCIAGLALAALYCGKAQQKQLSSIMESGGGSLDSKIDNILAASQNQPNSVLRECAGWPGLAEYIGDSSCTRSADVEAKISLIPGWHGLAGAAVFSPDGSIACQKKGLGYDTLAIFDGIEAHKLIAKSGQANFYARIGNRIFEYFGSGIYNGALPSDGCLMLAREVSDSYIDGLKSMLGSKHAGLAFSEKELEDARYMLGSARFGSHQLNNHYGNPVAYLYFSSEDALNSMIKRNMPIFLLLAGIVILTLITLLIYIRLSIVRPLRQTSKIVSTGDFEDLGKIGERKTEFGLLAKGIENMLEQKRDAEQKRDELQKQSSSLKEQRDGLEQQKKELESQIGNMEVLNLQVMEHDKETERKNLQLGLKNKELEEQNEINTGLRARLNDTEYMLKRVEKSLCNANEQLQINQNYAARLRNVLQMALTPTKHIFNDFFTLSKPKEKIGGDFWFAKKIENWVIAGVGDCNMHGLLGAQISAMDIYLIDEIINRTKISELSPESVLGTLNERMQDAISEDADANIERDGLHMSLFMYNTQTLKGMFAASKRTMVIMRQGEVTEYFGDNLSIGKIHDDRKFNLLQIQLKPDDIVYMFTDGCTEVEGGPYCKRLLTVNFKKEIAKKHIYPMMEQKNQFNKFFSDWIGELEQTDDITMLAYRI